METNEEQWLQLKQTYPIGYKFWAKVARIRPYGIFIKLKDLAENKPKSKYMGLIDIGHTLLYKECSKKLPLDYSQWPQKDTYINCVVCYYREKNKQLGLSWLGEVNRSQPD